MKRALGLVVEDDPDLRARLCRQIRAMGLVDEVMEESSGLGALALVQDTSFAVLALDLGLPDADGLDLLPRLLQASPGLPIICLTGRDEARAAVRALGAGAIAYLVKPWDREELEVFVRRAVELRRAQAAQEIGRRAAAQAPAYAAGRSRAWARVLELARDAGRSPRATVLLRGESGTGKEVVAALVHGWSPRAAQPYVTSNVASIPAGLVESEFFGHEAGAFTGAGQLRRGLFELASEGTLFLDEIGEMPLELQPRLLRVLEGQPFRRLGGEREIHSNARILAATHRDLETMVGEGRFRADFLFRLRVIEIHLPPLRERREDVEPLAVHFLARIAAEHGTPRLGISPEALARLASHGWPGNVRELKNTMERAALLSRGERIEVEHLALDTSPPPAPRPELLPSAPPGSAPLTLEQVVQQHVEHVWELCGGNLSQTARALDISRVALRRRLRAAGLIQGTEDLPPPDGVVTDEPPPVDPLPPGGLERSSRREPTD